MNVRCVVQQGSGLCYNMKTPLAADEFQSAFFDPTDHVCTSAGDSDIPPVLDTVRLLPSYNDQFLTRD